MYDSIKIGDIVVQRASLRSKYLFILVIGLACYGAIFLVTSLNTQTSFLSTEVYTPLSNQYKDSDFMVKTEGCTIPAMLPLGNTIKKYVKYPDALTPCPHANYSLIERNKTHIWLSKNNDVFKHYNVSNRSNLKCCYSSFFRPLYVPDITSKFLDDRIVYNQCLYFNTSVDIGNQEFIRTICHYENVLIYDQFYIFAPKNISLYGQVNEASKEDTYNVLILGIDNISRLNFHRTMPKTAAFLKERGGIELMGYNKVGDNSYPNLVALLIGYEQTELKRICHPTKHSYFDDCAFLWHFYKQAGFYTAFAEDSAYLATFNYMYNGFRTKPTDYYARPFILQAEKIVGRNRALNTFLCMNEFHIYKVFLDYIEDIIDTLATSRLFGFFWEVTMTHDELNYPMTMDDSYEKFLKRLEASKYLEETIIFLVSDHGIRWGPIRSTKQGRLEEMLPLVYVLTPPSFRKKYKYAFKNLKENSRKLTTPFDMHETLMDLIDLGNVKDDKIESRMKLYYTKERGISLFLPIPGNRTCKSAGIADHWCTCHVGEQISTSSNLAITASTFLIKYLTMLTADYPECSPLELEQIVDIKEMVAVTPRSVKADWKEYLVVVKANPSGGIFEATLHYDSSDVKWNVVGTVSRLNLYGSQSRCVDDSQLKLYCYCGDN